uniref:Putative Homeobox-leucine zipper protein HAT5 n=1 Tax=Davidia involucrata TaxID=16924 RepID=A0A5B7C3L4_DAVIN
MFHGVLCVYLSNYVRASQVVSLTEKLQAKEAAGVPKSDPLPAADVPHVSSLQINVKVEDRLSTGSGVSAVVDEDGPQLVDSGDSCFPDDNYPGYVAPVDGVQSEEDDGGSDDGWSYFSQVFVAAEQQHHEDGETLGWWVWS